MRDESLLATMALRLYAKSPSKQCHCVRKWNYSRHMHFKGCFVDQLIEPCDCFRARGAVMPFDLALRAGDKRQGR
jgi:hypothetical protein